MATVTGRQGVKTATLICRVRASLYITDMADAAAPSAVASDPRLQLNYRNYLGLASGGGINQRRRRD